MGNEQDLEKLRDEKCVPVAQGMLGDIAEKLMPENANDKIDYNPVILALQQRTLDADLNVAMEVPYVFQLLTGALQALNTTVQTCTFVEADDIRYGAIGKKILGILAASGVKLVDVKPEDIATLYAPVKEQLQALFNEEKLTWLEIKYIMDNIFDAYGDVENAFMQILKQNGDKATAKLLGVPFVSDLGLKKLDEVLKA